MAWSPDCRTLGLWSWAICCRPPSPSLLNSLTSGPTGCCFGWWNKCVLRSWSPSGCLLWTPLTFGAIVSLFCCPPWLSVGLWTVAAWGWWPADPEDLYTERLKLLGRRTCIASVSRLQTCIARLGEKVSNWTEFVSGGLSWGAVGGSCKSFLLTSLEDCTWGHSYKQVRVRSSPAPSVWTQRQFITCLSSVPGWRVQWPRWGVPTVPLFSVHITVPGRKAVHQPINFQGVAKLAV